MSKKHCLTLDLKDDPDLIQQYEEHHRKVWPEIISSIKDAGIGAMEIYRFGSRLVMIIEVSDDFSFENKNEKDRINTKVQEWEKLMENYQQRLMNGSSTEKWQLMKQIFNLGETRHDAR